MPSPILLLFISQLFFCISWAETTEPDTEDNGPIWFPGRPLLDEDHIPAPIPDSRPQSRWEGEYTNCIADKQENGIPLGQALEECKELKDGFGDVGDVVGIPHEATPYKVIYNQNGEWVQESMPAKEMLEALNEIQRRKIRLREVKGQVELIDLSLTGATVLQSAPARQWQSLFQQNPMHLNLASIASRGLLRAATGVAKFGLRRVSGILAASPLAAAEFCSPYQNFKGMNSFLESGRSSQLEVVRKCPVVARNVQVFHQNYGNN